MTKTDYSPVLHASANDLRVTGQNVEGHPRLRSVQFCDEIQQSFSDPYTLIVGQHNKSAHPIVSRPHSYVHDSDERYRSALVDSCVTSRGGSQGPA
jgi:hypothetical protein